MLRKKKKQGNRIGVLSAFLEEGWSGRCFKEAPLHCIEVLYLRTSRIWCLPLWMKLRFAGGGQEGGRQEKSEGGKKNRKEEKEVLKCLI